MPSSLLHSSGQLHNHTDHTERLAACQKAAGMGDARRPAAPELRKGQRLPRRVPQTSP